MVCGFRRLFPETDWIFPRLRKHHSIKPNIPSADQIRYIFKNIGLSQSPQKSILSLGYGPGMTEQHMVTFVDMNNDR
jgi:hypothetical protein